MKPARFHKLVTSMCHAGFATGVLFGMACSSEADRGDAKASESGGAGSSGGLGSLSTAGSGASGSSCGAVVSCFTDADCAAVGGVCDGASEVGGTCVCAGSTSAGPCVPLTCETANGACGSFGDGCDGTLTCPCNSVCAQTRSPTQAGNDASFGDVPWRAPMNVLESDGASADLTGLTGGVIPNYLSATAFGFDIPKTNPIAGIEVDWERSCLQSGFLYDLSVRVVKAGAPYGSDAPASDPWDVVVHQIYGGPDDLWEGSWTAADVDDPGFGAALSVVYKFSAGNDFVYVDSVQMTVHYACFTAGE